MENGARFGVRAIPRYFPGFPVEENFYDLTRTLIRHFEPAAGIPTDRRG